MTSPTRTRTDLINEALDNLGVLTPGQDPAPEDSDKVDDKLDALLANLAAREIVYVANVEAIPNEWFTALADYVAFGCMAAFGVTGEEAANLKLLKDQAELDLKAMNRGKATYETLRAVYV